MRLSFIVSDMAKEKTYALFVKEEFGNRITIDKEVYEKGLFDKVIKMQAARLATMGNLSIEKLCTMLPEDIPFN